MGIILKWKIDKVIILPFGALTIFNEDLNRKMIEEFLIVIMGPVFQIIYTLFINDIEVTKYSIVILLFNLIPIYPLDGSKIVNLFLNKITSFKKSHLYIIYISFLSIIFLIIKSDFNLIMILILSFLIIKLLDEIRNHNNLFNRFLLERYLKKYHFKKYKKIENINSMKRDYSHLIYNKNKYFTEREILNKRFDFHNKT